MLPGRFFSPHQTDLPTHIGFIKRAKHKIRVIGDACIRCHFRQKRSANTVGYHLYDCRETGRLVGNGDIHFPQLARLKCMIPKAVPLFQKQHLSTMKIFRP